MQKKSETKDESAYLILGQTPEGYKKSKTDAFEILIAQENIKSYGYSDCKVFNYSLGAQAPYHDFLRAQIAFRIMLSAYQNSDMKPVVYCNSIQDFLGMLGDDAEGFQRCVALKTYNPE